jgi:hypothetical protein
VRRTLTIAIFVALPLLASPLTGVPLAAQERRRVEASPAEVAISQGRLDDAERELYAASRRDPRDPSARGALGSLLASRGHLRIGAVLLEEARQFGGDALAINARLAHVYRWLADWPALAALPTGAAYDGAEKERARWTAAHLSSTRGADSTTVRLEPNEVAGFGRITLRIGAVDVPADLDPTIAGIALVASADLLGGLQLFGERDGVTLAVAPIVAFGSIVRTNVPVTIVGGGTARVGFDVLAALTPTFNAADRTLTLRVRVGTPAAGREIPILLGFPGVRIVTRTGQGPVAIESAAGRAALRGTVWTLSIRRGAIITPE